MESTERIKLCVWVVLFLITVPTCLSLEITRLSIPKFVKNASEESVLLDCEFTYNVGEEKRLVVKWFHENDPQPVYQWIPELNSKSSSGKFLIDTTHVIPDGGKFTKSRAIKFLWPTTGHSGKFLCHISSLAGEDSEIGHMTVYALPSSLTINYTAADGIVKVICEVKGVYPIPEMSLFHIPPGMLDSVPIEDTELKSNLVDGSYELELSTNFTEDELEDQRFFGCVVSMNGTGYEEEVQIPYLPAPKAEKQESDDSDENAASRCTEVLSVATFFLTLLFLLT